MSKNLSDNEEKVKSEGFYGEVSGEKAVEN